jgi:hypothetical protein
MQRNVLLGRLVYAFHVLVFLYGLFGWLLRDWLLLHLCFLIGLRVHWHLSDACILTVWERRLLGDQAEPDRHFTRDLLRRLGFRDLSVDGAWKVLDGAVTWIMALDIVVLLVGWP